MEKNRSCPLATVLATRIRGDRDSLAALWLERMVEREDSGADAAAHEDVVLERITLLIDGVAGLIDDTAQAAAGDVLRERARQLAHIRYRQGLDAGDFLKDCGVLAELLSAKSYEVVRSPDSSCDADEVHECTRRMFGAVFLVEHAAAERYSRMQGERIGDREERLRRLSRTVTHELKNRVGATLGAGQLLQEEWLGDAERIRFAGMVEENALAIQEAVETLAALSRMDGERRRHRTVPLDEAVSDVFRQLRELARARDVELRIDAPLPAVEVNASAFEVSLSAYVYNAVKFSNAGAAQRWAEVSAAVEQSPDASDATELVVRVRDNGTGVPAEAREHLFERFHRGHEEMSGAGLGLSQVRDTVRSIGGRVWAELDQERGSVFAFALPSPDARANERVSGAGASVRDARPRRDPAPAKASDSRP